MGQKTGSNIHPEGRADAVIKLHDVSKHFQVGKSGITALDQVTVEVKSHMVTGLIGPDGAGKTTLMRLIAGILHPDRGQVLTLGMDASTDFLHIQASIGYMPQHFGLYEDLTVQENLDLYADLQGLAAEKRADRYDKLMQMTGLASFTSRLAGRLSGGMKQKLGLACTLVKPPALLILDEPTVGVDPVSRRELWSIVYQQVKEKGMSVLLSTSYLDEAERCQEVILMHEGHVLGQDIPGNFSHEILGRSFMLSSRSGNLRRLQEQLSLIEEITDAIIIGNRIRLVVEKQMTVAEVENLFAGIDRSLEVKKVPPRFEDAFISILKNRLWEEGRQAGTKAITPSKVSGSDDEDVIMVENLQRRFGDFYAVKNLSFTVRRGEIFGLLGANGAGKSTTFRMLCGLLPSSGGKLMVAGRDLHTARAPARALVGYMAQKFSLYAGLSVRQNLKFFSSAYGLYGRRQKERVDWVLTSFELGSFADNNSGRLPLGYKQRLALGTALLHEPEILFLDEPTSGVDPLARREFWRHINALAEAGVTVMVTTHFMEEAEYCDRLVIMAQGEVLAQGTPEEMKVGYRSESNPNPTMEDTFVALIEEFENGDRKTEQ